MVYFPYHVLRYELVEIKRNFMWLFCSDACKQDWIEYSLAERGSRLGIIQACIYDFVEQAV